MKMKRKFLIIVMPVALALVISGCSGMGMRQTAGAPAAHEGHSMAMHHQHLMLNHALGMALQGSNLVMIGQMGMAPGIDETAVSHGNMMLKNARAAWNDTMSGETMTGMHSSGKSPAADPMMKYTHELAEAQLKVIDMLEKHAGMKGHSMASHHQHVVINHALEMALEGADIAMTGKMGMAPGVDAHSMDHGRKMIAEARGLWNEVMSGDAMMKMHGQGMTPGSDASMKFTHEMGEAQMKVFDLLENMP